MNPIEWLDLLPAERRRLAIPQLLRVLHNVQAKSLPFDITQWYAEDIESQKPEALSSPACGTAACIAGWAMRDSWFNQRGLVYSPTHWCPVIGKASDQSPAYSSWIALEVFFGFSHREVMKIFNWDIYNQGEAQMSPQDLLAQRINQLTAMLEAQE